jgi:hypothetical protein
MKARRPALALSMLVGLGCLAAQASTAVAATVVPYGTTYSSDATWIRAGSPWIVNSFVRVNAGATLTIEPGAVVKFKSGRAPEINGNLHAVGTTDERITFTSIKDDTGGDDGADGVTAGARGDWGALKIAGSAEMTYVDVRYGSAISNGPYTGSLSAQITLSAIYVAPAGQLTMDHARVTDNLQTGWASTTGARRSRTA